MSAEATGLPQRTWVKICGLTNLEDAQAAVDAGADALGFVFAESPRRVTADQVAKITARLPEWVTKAGVFVREPSGAIREALEQAGLDAAQIHVSADDAARLADLRERLGARHAVWPAISARLAAGGSDWIAANATVGLRVFVDSGSAVRPGGTGVAFDWDAARPFVESLKQVAAVVIAGGLHPANVADAIRKFAPFGVDVSTGVGSTPGKKDHGKMRDFVAAVRAADTAK